MYFGFTETELNFEGGIFLRHVRCRGEMIFYVIYYCNFFKTGLQTLSRMENTNPNKIKIIDRVTAGDSFGAGLIFALNTPELSAPEKAISFAAGATSGRVVR